MYSLASIGFPLHSSPPSHGPELWAVGQVGHGSWGTSGAYGLDEDGGQAPSSRLEPVLCFSGGSVLEAALGLHPSCQNS
jgi:hypothetical protein